MGGICYLKCLYFRVASEKLSITNRCRRYNKKRMSYFRSRTVAGVIAWKLTALVLLPIVLSATAGCPLSRQAVVQEVHAEQQVPPDTSTTLVPCDSLEDTLLTLLSLTGFVSESESLQAKFVSYGVVTVHSPVELNADTVPMLRPPRGLV